MGQAFANYWKAASNEMSSIHPVLPEVCLLSRKNTLGGKKRAWILGCNICEGDLISLWVFPESLPHPSSIGASVRLNQEDGHTGTSRQGKGTGEILKDTSGARGVEGVGLEVAVPQAGRDGREQHGECRRCGFE